jgi:hypothetical protein
LAGRSVEAAVLTDAVLQQEITNTVQQLTGRCVFQATVEMAESDFAIADFAFDHVDS